MNMFGLNFATRAIIGVSAIVLLLGIDMSQAQAQTERAPLLRTGDVLPGVPLQGPYYKIASTVQNDGLQNIFTVTVENRSYKISQITYNSKPIVDKPCHRWKGFVSSAIWNVT